MDGPQSADAKTFKNTEPHHSIASDVWGLDRVQCGGAIRQ